MARGRQGNGAGSARGPRAAVALVVAACVSCTGSIDEGTASPEGAAADPADRATGTSSEGEAPNRFEVPKSRLQLLPFDVRLEKVARVAGVDADDPLLAPIRQRKNQLGGHDYANGVLPDLQWNASRMALWVEVLQPLCDSEQIRSRFPSMSEDLRGFVETAYGRSVGAEEVAAIEEQVAAAGALDEQARYRTVCLVILSSAEFVLR